MTKKHYFLAILFVLCGFSPLFAQKDADKIVGVWLNQEKDGTVEIFKKGDKYYGKIKTKSSTREFDDKNPDTKLQKRKLIGLEILENFTYSGDNVWEEGTIYDPKSGKTYSCKMTLEKDNKTLNIRGFIGFSMFGRTTVWTRP